MFIFSKIANKEILYETKNLKIRVYSFLSDNGDGNDDDANDKQSPPNFTRRAFPNILQVVLIPVNLFFFAIVAVLFLLFVSDDR